MRHQGVGQLLGRVMESQALESLALNGGLAVVVAVLELAFAAWMLAAARADAAPAGAAALAGRDVGALLALLPPPARLVAARLDMTNGLIERMVGHRTRLAQERPERRDAAEDRSMQDYLGLHAIDACDRAGRGRCRGRLDHRGAARSGAGLRRGNRSPAGLAISLGGMLLANRAFAGIVRRLASLAQAGRRLDPVSELFRAGGAPAEARPSCRPCRPRPRRAARS